MSWGCGQGDVVNIEIDLEKKYVKTSLVPFGRDSLGE